MNKNHPKVSVIIPVFRDYDRLDICLRSLEAQSYPRLAFEIIVVDNGTETIPDASFGKSSKVLWVQEQRPSSYAARNLGIKNSTGAILAFIDSDCIPNPDWLERGVVALGRLEAPSYVGGRVDVFPQDAAKPTPTEFYEMATAFPMESYMRDSHFGGAGNLFIHREVIDRVGLFNADLQSGGDAEFGRRVFAAGIPQLYADDVIVLHPARRTLHERLEKAYRVFSGIHDIQAARRGQGPIETDLWQYLKPPGRSLLRVLTNRKIPSLSGRIQAASVHLALHYAKAVEFTRVYKLGLTPRGKR